MTRKCFHGNRENYLTVEIVDQSGNTVDYEIYFTVSRSSKPGVIDLHVQSAYTRDVRHAANRPKMKEIAFPVILFNALKR